MWQTGGSTTTRYGYDGTEVWADLDGSNNLTARYLRGDLVDQLFARITYSGGTGTPAWYLTDRLGSVRDIMDKSGSTTLLDHIDYTGFGVATESNSSNGDRYKFTGREFDSETGYYHTGARPYDPATGRFTSMDPLEFGAGDPNLYRYVGNDATNAVDPSGLSPLDYIKAVGEGLYEGGRNLLIGAGDAVVEMGQMARDIGNTVVAGGYVIANRAYDYELHSQTFGGFERAVGKHDGSADRFYLNTIGNGASLGVKPLVEGVVDFCQTGDATNASRTSGGVAASNLIGAATLKVTPKIPLPFRRGKVPAPNPGRGPVHIDIGGEGRYPDAINVNPGMGGGRPVTSGPTQVGGPGAAGRPIPNLVQAPGEQLPFANQSVDTLTLQNAPIRPATISEIARVIKPGGDIRLVGPNTPQVLAAHQQVANAVGGRVYQTVVGDCVYTNIIVPAR